MAVHEFSNTGLSLNTPGCRGSAVELEFGQRNLAFQPLSSSLLMPSCTAWQVTSYTYDKCGNCSVSRPRQCAVLIFHASSLEATRWHSIRYFLDAWVLIVKFCYVLELLSDIATYTVPGIIFSGPGMLFVMEVNFCKSLNFLNLYLFWCLLTK